MIIKKFQGKTELEATEAAKKELGSNIVTMNVRSVKRKGFLRFFLKDLVEVTVALEEENEKYSPVKKEEKKEKIDILSVTTSTVILSTFPFQNNELCQLNVRTKFTITRFQPSASTNNKILNGMEIVVGGSIIIPILISTDATTISITINGI